LKAIAPFVGQFIDVQSVFDSHALPAAQLGAHDGGAQTEPTQLADWQSPLTAHEAPSEHCGLQVGAAHLKGIAPFVGQFIPAQSTFDSHALPIAQLGAHDGGTQTFPTQFREAQLPSVAQALPSEQVGSQVGFWQVFAFPPVVGQFIDAHVTFDVQWVPSGQAKAHGPVSTAASTTSAGASADASAASPAPVSGVTSAVASEVASGGRSFASAVVASPDPPSPCGASGLPSGPEVTASFVVVASTLASATHDAAGAQIPSAGSPQAAPAEAAHRRRMLATRALTPPV
jgi:hypothetical protein